MTSPALHASSQLCLFCRISALGTIPARRLTRQQRITSSRRPFCQSLSRLSRDDSTPSLGPTSPSSAAQNVFGSLADYYASKAGQTPSINPSSTELDAFRITPVDDAGKLPEVKKILSGRKFLFARQSHYTHSQRNREVRHILANPVAMKVRAVSYQDPFPPSDVRYGLAPPATWLQRQHQQHQHSNTATRYPASGTNSRWQRPHHDSDNLPNLFSRQSLHHSTNRERHESWGNRDRDNPNSRESGNRYVTNSRASSHPHTPHSRDSSNQVAPHSGNRVAPNSRDSRDWYASESRDFRDRRNLRASRNLWEAQDGLPQPLSTDLVSEKFKRLMEGAEVGGRRQREQRLKYDQHSQRGNPAGSDRSSLKERQARQRTHQITAQQSKLSLPPYISLSNLAALLRVRNGHLVSHIQRNHLLENIENLLPDQVINAEDAGIIAMEFGFSPAADHTAVDLLPAPPPDPTTTKPKPPVVTIMGHVDHGKTTILDYLRKSSIVDLEHGGITQHIGAFVVKLGLGKTITFLDTPGHAAFLTMRQRGANVTNVVVLVVAADDGVMPQTVEAIKHAQAAKVPMIVAVNKIDREDADLDRVKQDLSSHGIEIEDFGGDTQVIPVSGKTGQGMQNLEEAISTLAEILDLRAPIYGPAEGWVIEMSTKSHGRTATVLITRGTLVPGTIIVAGRAWAKVRTLHNEHGQLIDSAAPGMPVEVDGWRIVAEPGSQVLQANDEQHATAIVKTRDNLADMLRTAADIEAINESRALQKDHMEASKAHRALYYGKRSRYGGPADPQHQKRVIEGIFVDRTQFGENSGPREVFFVVKADVTGSVEAVESLIGGIGNNEVRPRVVDGSAGLLTESDVDLAAAVAADVEATRSGTAVRDGIGGDDAFGARDRYPGCQILVFNTGVDPRVRAYADQCGVELIEESIIYRISEHVTRALERALPPKISTRVTGEAQVLQSFAFRVGGKRDLMIAGCRVRNGNVKRGDTVRVMRNGDVVYTGTIDSLKQHKKSVEEMRKDSECGMTFGDAWEGFQDGDIVQCFVNQREKRKLV